MQSATATLIAALQSFVRQPAMTATMTAGTAYDDLTPVVESVIIDRSLTTDLPAEAQQVQGYSVGQATVTLGGDFSDGQSVERVLSPYLGFLGGASPVLKPLSISLGAITAAGRELLTVFTGRVRQVQSGDRTVSLTALDATELLRTKVSLAPAVKSDPGNSNYGPGVTPAWCAEQVLRQNGYVWRNPLDRPQCILAATMEGSAQPHVGYLSSGIAFGRRTSAPLAGGPVAFASLDGGTWSGLDRNDSSTLGTWAYWFLSDPQPVNTGNVLVEWYRVQVARPSSGSYYLFSLQSAVPGTDGVDIRISSTGGLVADYNRGSTVVTSASLGTLPTTTAYLAMHFAFSGAGVTINCRINGTTTNVVVANAAAPTDTIRTLAVEAVGTTTSTRAYMGQVNVTTEVFASTMWQDSTLYTLTPTVTMDAFLGEMVAVPPVDDEPAWPVLQEIAEAEQGAMVLLENGTVRFYNRATLQDASGTAVATFAHSRALKALNASQAVDGVRNSVTVPAVQYQAQDAAAELWSLSEVVALAGFETRAFPVQLPGALVSVTDVIRFARPNPDGSGADVTADIVRGWVAAGRTRGYVTVTNTASSTRWLVDATGAASVILQGRCIVPGDTYTATSTDPGSANTYGDQVLDVSENRFRQTGPAAEALAAILVSVLKDPHPQIAGVEIVGDVRLQLVDRVTLTDPDGLGMARDFMTVGVRTSHDDSGLSQSLTLRERGPATTGMTGTLVWDDPTTPLDSTYGWA